MLTHIQVLGLIIAAIKAQLVPLNAHKRKKVKIKEAETEAVSTLIPLKIKNDLHPQGNLTSHDHSRKWTVHVHILFSLLTTQST